MHVYDFSIRLDDATRTALDARPEADIEREFCAAFGAAWRGDVETDRFSALVLRAGLPWREVAVLRAYARYARQIGAPYGLQYMADTLLAHPDVARGAAGALPGPVRPGAPAPRARRWRPPSPTCAPGSTPSPGLDADRILRSFLAMIMATLRTNWFRERPFFSFKIDPSQVPGMPAPRPRFEIFVYSPRVEGVHLRFGSVARGGLRWSDRPADYRTEILGLVKAQAVKNAVIVPVGAKGGFVVRASGAGPRRGRGLLPHLHLRPARRHRQPRRDGTWSTVPPPDVVRHDADDSYLVVAADKGTAKFSDIANEVAMSYGFWLGDAFASGGSVGYDHKAMGITAKGAWESVKRHFRELGVDTQNEEFTVVGVGDMSGDVFGNGMLLSRHIRLLAAFDHRHVFVDPDPDAATSFAERERMFALPRSSWDDYDRATISAGGGVWPRTAKTVPVGPEMRAALGHRRGRHRAEPARADRGHPARPGRPAVERRHRHLRQGVHRVARRRGRQDQRHRARRRQASCASRWWGRAATSGSPSAAASSSPAPAERSTPTRSTTRRVSTAPTTRSTSRSCWTGSS